MTTLNPYIWAWMLLAILLLPFLVRIKAPYGRHQSRAWGPLMDNRLGWVVMELPALLVVPICFLLGEQNRNIVGYLILALWLLHYGHRTLIFPLRTRTRGKQIPIAVVAMAIVFNLVNGGFLGLQIGFAEPGYGLEWLSDPRCWMGVGLFLAGFWINWKSDDRLIHLRKPGETGYSIPYGGWFRWVSCPNHFGEIIEWVGFAMLTWSWAGLSFAVWTAANLIPRALDHHRWYQDKFAEYPKNRKAVIPFIL
ncbi:DUF1295 domain-containing protein [Pontibacter sp. G13]|uniref:DUF1295 domain-containing protein n=1 Tax=Pontibacter sp. G13 TaxID=3074898 RepID=UPI00288A9C47|nr:methyltransferase [Pontibacter sp. G13]WNJ19399.1 methyltransferase [Pontibacter sp. G13]